MSETLTICAVWGPQAKLSETEIASQMRMGTFQWTATEWKRWIDSTASYQWRFKLCPQKANAVECHAPNRGEPFQGYLIFHSVLCAALWVRLANDYCKALEAKRAEQTSLGKAETTEPDLRL